MYSPIPLIVYDGCKVSDPRIQHGYTGFTWYVLDTRTHGLFVCLDSVIRDHLNLVNSAIRNHADFDQFIRNMGQFGYVEFFPALGKSQKPILYFATAVL